MISTKELIEQLYAKIFTTATLHQVSEILEIMASDTRFKQHANAIVTDPSLTDPQKRTQLVYLFKGVNSPVLYEFLVNQIGPDNFWLMTTGKIDYFDKFVQEFQMATEAVGVVYLTTAINLSDLELRDIAQDLSRTFGYKVVINHNVNPQIIGGAQVKVENMVFDYSLATKFAQFQRQWVASVTKTNKQVGREEL